MVEILFIPGDHESTGEGPRVAGCIDETLASVGGDCPVPIDEREEPTMDIVTRLCSEVRQRRNHVDGAIRMDQIVVRDRVTRVSAGCRCAAGCDGPARRSAAAG